MSAIPKLCCGELMEAAMFHQAFAGGGFLYPPGQEPTGQIEQDRSGSWNVNGCCGGGCYVLHKIKHCPWCGAPLPTKPTL